jgi:DNA-binding response OmpR family regulator
MYYPAYWKKYRYKASGIIFMRILLVEDEKKLSAVIKRGLIKAQYTVDLVENGDDVSFMIESNPYDLIILDIMLPGKDGITICQDLRKNNNHIPILMLTALNDLDDKISGLDSGADDYLTKPFSFSELLARVRALQRRKSLEKSTCLKVADLELDQLKHKVTRSGSEVKLTSTEYALLEYLMLNVGQEVTRTMISEHVWKDEAKSFSNLVNVYVNLLRKKIDQGHERNLIHSMRGVGYILKDK